MLTGMNYIAPLALFGSRTAQEESRIPEHVAYYHTLLTALVQDRLDIEAAAQPVKINDLLLHLIKEEGV